MRPLLVLAVLAFIACDAKPSAWQYLPAKPGYVPVYIQSGDTPLEEINLELAEAFHAIPSGRSANGHDSIMAETGGHEEVRKEQKKQIKRAIDWSQESFGDEDDDDSLEFEIREALSRPDQNYERSIDLQILSRTNDRR